MSFNILDVETEIARMKQEAAARISNNGPFRIRDIVRINGKQVEVRVVQAMPGVRLDSESK